MKPTVRIPFLNRDDLHAPIRDCILRTAENMDWPPEQAAIGMTVFFEALMEQVCQGKIVRIPGFGIFGPQTRFRNVTGKVAGTGRKVFPAFHSSRMFKNAVRLRVRTASSKEFDPIRKHCNSFRRKDTNQPPDIFWQNFRDLIVAANRPENQRRHKIGQPTPSAY